MCAVSSGYGGAYDELLRAAELGDARFVEQRLNLGLDQNTADPKGNTLLMIAARNGHKELVWLLIRRKARHSRKEARAVSRCIRVRQPAQLKLY